MADEMKINLYEVENHSDIEMVLNEIKDMDLKNRVRLVNGYDMKLEEIKTETYEGVKIYLWIFPNIGYLAPVVPPQIKLLKIFLSNQTKVW